MNENIFISSTDETVSGAKVNSAFATIVCGGLTAGVLDCFAATISSNLRGVTFVQVWQYVASGLLGKESYNYGWTSVFLGLFIHFFIAFTVTTIYYLASRRLPLLIQMPLICGFLYAFAVYFVMRHIVIPLSAAANFPFSVSSMLTGLIIHIVCIGLPIAFIVRRFSQTGN